MEASSLQRAILTRLMVCEVNSAGHGALLFSLLHLPLPTHEVMMILIYYLFICFSFPVGNKPFFVYKCSHLQCCFILCKELCKRLCPCCVVESSLSGAKQLGFLCCCLSFLFDHPFSDVFFFVILTRLFILLSFPFVQVSFWHFFGGRS